MVVDLILMMGVHIVEDGKMGKHMAMVYALALKDRANTPVLGIMDLKCQGSTHGQVVIIMKVNGRMVNDMGWA